MPRIAIVYDRLTTEFGGAEVVLECLMQAYPTAVLYTTVYSQAGIRRFSHREVRASFLHTLWPLNNSKMFAGLLSPLAFESLNLEAFDIVISVTSNFAKGVITKPTQLHICYLLTPTRFLHSHKTEYQNMSIFGTLPVIKTLFEVTRSYLTRWDTLAALRPDYILPISQLVAKRTQYFYATKPLEPLYPPVAIPLSDREVQALPKLRAQYFLVISRLVAYKKISVAVTACIKSSTTLIVAGTGEELAKLISLAGDHGIVRDDQGETLQTFIDRAAQLGKTILFTQQVSQQEAWTLMKNMQALLMPAQEDFGITAIEACFFGKPSILHGKSGVSELLEHKKHAIFITKATVSEVETAITTLLETRFLRKELRQIAKKHSSTAFIEQFTKTTMLLWKMKQKVSTT